MQTNPGSSGTLHAVTISSGSNGGSTLTVATGANSVNVQSGGGITLGGTLNTLGTVTVASGGTLGLSGGAINDATLAGAGTHLYGGWRQHHYTGQFAHQLTVSWLPLFISKLLIVASLLSVTLPVLVPARSRAARSTP